MRAEEYDWTIYHVITGERLCTIERISERTGYNREIVEESLGRLRSNLLIDCRGEQYRACSIEEFLITNQMKHDPLSGITIENGVVKVKKADDKDPAGKRQENTAGIP